MNTKEVYDTKYVWHCDKRHSEVCRKHFKCRGTECVDWNGSKNSYAKTPTKEKKCS